ncbi:MAG: membrane protein insertion efficiency factor YidD [Deltaproteobacteria bacterium]|nr:membrane protein insertion efficiency factor YidD [Deltaproteobacteria bacterium]
MKIPHFCPAPTRQLLAPLGRLAGRRARSGASSCWQLGVPVLGAALATLLAGTAAAEPFGPWSADPRHPVTAEAARPEPESLTASRIASCSPFGLAFRLWSRLLTRIDGPRCAHRPSCAQYAHQAMARHGLPKGAWLALDRLMRGARSSALRALPIVAGPGGAFFLDPLPGAGDQSASGW